MARFGRRNGLTVSYLLSCLGAFFGVVAITQGWFWMLLLSASFIGLSRAGGDQSRYIPGEMFPESERARMIGWVVFAGVAGAISGPLTITPSLLLTNFLGLDENTGPWLMAFIFYLAAATLIFLFLRHEPLQIARQLDGKAKKSEPVSLPKQDSRGRFNIFALLINAIKTLFGNVRELISIPGARLAVLSMVIAKPQW